MCEVGVLIFGMLEVGQCDDSCTLGAPEGWSVRRGELKVRTVTHSEHSRAQSEDSYTLGAPGSSAGSPRTPRERDTTEA